MVKKLYLFCPFKNQDSYIGHDSTNLFTEQEKRQKQRKENITTQVAAEVSLNNPLKSTSEKQ